MDLMAVPEEEWEHGKRYTYTKLKCRCDLCKEANAEYKRNKTAHYANLQASEARQDISPDAQAFLDSLTHGIPSTYEWFQCRCNLCTEAQAKAVETRNFIKLLSA